MEPELLPHTTSEQKAASSKGSADARTLIGLIILICLMLLYSQLSSAQTIRSAASGPWNSATTWQGGTIPQAINDVQILNGHVITITGAVACKSVELVPPPNNDKNYIKTELMLVSGASLTTSVLYLNSKNDRRYTSLVNNGAIITSGTLNIGRGSILTNTAGNLTVTGSIVNDGDIDTDTAKLQIGSTYSGSGVFIKGTGTVNYTGTAASGQSIAPLAYHHLQLSGSNTKTSAGAFTVSGDLQVAPGTTLESGLYNHTITGDILNKGVLASETTQPTSLTVGGDMVNTGTTIAGAATYYINGDWSNSGSFQAGTSTIVLQGNRLQQISGDNTFYNLIFRGTAQAQLQQDVAVIKGISINNSHLNTGANTIWLGTDAGFSTLETDAAHVIGSVKTTRTLTAATPENFGNIGLTLTRNEINPGQITVERITGVATEILDGTQSVTRQYNISRSGTNDISALSMTMDLTFLPNELKSKPLNEYKLYNKGQDKESLPVPSTVMTQTTMRHNNSNRFGTFTLGPQPMPLPVELVWFKAAWRERVVLLEWKTASEQDNKGFEVQVSEDGRIYKPVGFVQSKSPDSRVAQFYSYTYANPSRSHTSYFRLKQVDYSGKISYSKAQAVNAPAKALTFEAFPNPFTDQIQFASDATEVQVTLTDLNGKMVLKQQLGVQDLTDQGYFKLSTNQLLTKGIYLLTVHTPEQVYKTKLLKK